jgi:hypothetical protein
MAALSAAQITELFHIAFLDVLSKRLDPTRYVLKGGANLRYFFGSVRYSEDIDLDITGVPEWRLAEKVNAVLSSPPMQALLRAGGLRVAESSHPKQTETTQRWKVGVEARGQALLTRTKIEFSYRNGDDRYRLEPVPSELVEPYALRPPSIQHYVDDAPTEQKVLALAGRSETQARDAFDLELLLRRRSLTPGALEPELLTRAADRALELPFAAFRDQVLPFLEPEVVELYASEESWSQMQTFVAEKLEGAA